MNDAIIVAIVAATPGAIGLILALFQLWSSRGQRRADAAGKVAEGAEKVLDISENMLTRMEGELNSLKARFTDIEEKGRRLEMANEQLRVRVKVLEEGIVILTNQLDDLGAQPIWRLPCTMPRTIIIVDDNPTFSHSLSAILKHAHYKVHEIPDGASLVEQAREDPHVVILMDMVLKDESGIDLVREVRKFNNNIPIIFVSGYLESMNKEIKIAMDELNAFACLPKPVNIKELLGLISKIEDEDIAEARRTLTHVE